MTGVFKAQAKFPGLGAGPSRLYDISPVLDGRVLRAGQGFGLSGNHRLQAMPLFNRVSFDGLSAGLEKLACGGINKIVYAMPVSGRQHYF